MEASGYFRVVAHLDNERAGDDALAKGDVQFVVNIPVDFSRKLLRGERPALLLEADATDPAATSNALSAISQLAQTVLAKDLRGPLAVLNGDGPPIDLRIQCRYNPEGITQYNIVPALMG